MQLLCGCVLKFQENTRAEDLQHRESKAIEPLLNPLVFQLDRFRSPHEKER